MKLSVVLLSAAALLAGLSSSLSAQTVSPIAFLDGTKNEYPEGLTVGRDGNCYLTLVFAGKIIKVTPAGVQSDFVAIPDNWLLGLKFDRAGNLFVCGASGIWKVPPGGTPTLFAPIPGHNFLNDLVIDRRGNLYVADSFSYVIWKVDPQGNASVWSNDVLLQGKASSFPNQLGPNGLGLDEDERSLYVVITSAGRVVKFDIRHNGSAGAARALAEDASLVGADGMTLDEHDNVYIAVNIQDRIAVVTPRGRITEVASEGLLATPTGVAFGTRCNRDTLYVCNNGNVFFSGNPLGEGLLQITWRHSHGHDGHDSDRDCDHDD